MQRSFGNKKQISTKKKAIKYRLFFKTGFGNQFSKNSSTTAFAETGPIL